MTTIARSFLLTTLTAALSVACGSKDSGSAEAADSDAADGVQAAGSSAQTSRIEEMLYAPVTSTDPDMAAKALTTAQWWPAGCATRRGRVADRVRPFEIGAGRVHLDLD